MFENYFVPHFRYFRKQIKQKKKNEIFRVNPVLSFPSIPSKNDFDNKLIKI